NFPRPARSTQHWHPCCDSIQQRHQCSRLHLTRAHRAARRSPRRRACTHGALILRLQPVRHCWVLRCPCATRFSRHPQRTVLVSCSLFLWWVSNSLAELPLHVNAITTISDDHTLRSTQLCTNTVGVMLECCCSCFSIHKAPDVLVRIIGKELTNRKFSIHEFSPRHVDPG